MHEVLLQSIIEKLQRIEVLLKQDNADKGEESLKGIHEEIKKISATTLRSCLKTIQHNSYGR